MTRSAPAPVRAAVLGAVTVMLIAGAPASAETIKATFDCANGDVLNVTFDNEKNVAIVETEGLEAQTLPIAESGSGFYYTNGRYGLRGKGDEATWEVGRMAPIACKAAD